MNSSQRAAESVLRKQRRLRPLRRLLLRLPKWGPFGFLRFGLTQLDAGDLQVGDVAPDAPVVGLDGSHGSLLARLADRPLVLVFGSFTWPPFRRSVGRIKELALEFGEVADFLTVYIKEAHPEDEWQMGSNEKDGVCYAQPKDLDGRLAIARDFVQRFDYDLPFVVDTLDDRALQSYSAWPERLYAIGTDGRVAYKGGIGPFLFDPNELADWLRAP